MRPPRVRVAVHCRPPICGSRRALSSKGKDFCSIRYTFTATTVHGIETKVLDHVPAPDEKALASAMSTHLGAAAKLEQIDADTGAEGARSMLGGLAIALGITTGTT